MKSNHDGINYSTSTRNVQLLIDEGYAEKVIPAEDSVRLLDQIIWEKSTTKYEKRLTEKLSSRTAEYSAKYGIMADGAGLLAQRKAKHSAPFVHGRL